jgi:hypothetical protein
MLISKIGVVSYIVTARAFFAQVIDSGIFALLLMWEYVSALREQCDEKHASDM